MCMWVQSFKVEFKRDRNLMTTDRQVDKQMTGR